MVRKLWRARLTEIGSEIRFMIALFSPPILLGLILAAFLAWLAFRSTVAFAITSSTLQCMFAAIFLLLTMPQAELTVPGGAITFFIIWPALIWLCVCLPPSIYILFDRSNKRWLLNSVTLLILGCEVILGVSSGRSASLPYYHQVCIMGAAVAAATLIMNNSLAQCSRRKNLYMLAFSPTLGAICWSFVNIAIVSIKIKEQVKNHEYCIMAYSCSDGLYQINSRWDLRGYALYTPYCTGGMHDFQFGFHAVLLSADKTLNWSYQAQRFEKLSEATVHGMPGSVPLHCPKG
jgi:hypothetical protein